MDKITFETDNGVEEFFVLDQVRISGSNYLLVADSLEDEAEAMILKDVSGESDSDAVYVPVEDDTELDAVASIFAESLGDVDFE